MDLSTLFVDDTLIILDKPPGISVLVEGWQPGRTNLTDLVKEEFGPVWVVHRLDKTTSGVIVFARTSEAHRHLNTQFQNHQVIKTYHAILEGVPSWQEMASTQPLAPDRGHAHRTIIDVKNGKPSSTFFKVIRTFDLHSLVEILPKTGRTHQIRAHAAALGFPILGDHLYGAGQTTLIDRPALHAASIQFVHPVTQKQMTITSPFPVDFARTLAVLRSGND